MTDWCGGSGEVKRLTDVMAGASQMTDQCSNAVMQWDSGWEQVKWLTDVVAGTSQMTDWCGDAITLYV